MNAPPSSNQCPYCGYDDGKHNVVCIAAELQRVYALVNHWAAEEKRLRAARLNRAADASNQCACPTCGAKYNGRLEAQSLQHRMDVVRKAVAEIERFFGLRASDETSDVPTFPIAGDAEARFMVWLMKEMPAGTVIGAPSWWSPRIFKAVLRAIEVQEHVRPSAVETFDGCPACAGAPNAEHIGQCSTVKSPSRSMTPPERDAMNRAADRSVTVVDPGYTNEAPAHQPILPKVKMEPMGEWFTCRCNELHTLGDGHVCAVKASGEQK